MITRKLARLIPIALLAIIIASCSDENDNESGTKFTRITELSADDSSENFHTDLSYDNQGRLVLYNEVASPFYPTAALSFGYLGADSKPVSAHYDIADHYFTYNAEGRLIKDSIFTDDGVSTQYTQVKRISYPSASLIVVNSSTTGTGMGGTSQLSIDSINIDIRGNATQLKTYFQNPLNVWYLHTLTTWQYDNNKNPFGELNVFPVFQPGFLNVFFSVMNSLLLQKNNCVSSASIFYEEDGTIIGTDGWSFTPQYNSNDYISETTATRAGSVAHYRYVFSYE
ncbi:MAG: hypothetical protein H7Y86_04685 [Rhizobacter sp.]|nr:hypothetical protein [Ferruginibacter sp.]